MIEHGVAWDLEDVVLQFFQAADAHHLLVCPGITEDEISEAHVLFEQVAEVHAHLLRVLVYESEAFRFRLLPVVALRALYDQGQVFVFLSDGTEQLQSGFRVFR